MSTSFPSLQRALWLAGAVIAMAAAAQAQNLKCFVLTPPDQILEGVKQIAIADFTVTSSYDEDPSPEEASKRGLEKILGAVEKMSEAERHKSRFSDSGRKLADLMIADLLQKERGIEAVGSGFLGLSKKEGKSFQTGAYTNVFNVVERSEFQRVIDELQLGQSGVVNEATAAQVGQVLGVDAIIIGSVNVSSENRWIKENREDKKKGKYQVDCEKLVTSTSATIRFVKVSTGQVIGSKDSQQKQEQKKCRGEYGSDLPTPEMAVDKCLNGMAEELVNYFAPRFELQKLDFAKIEGEEFKRAAEIAKKGLEAYDLNTAYVQYAAMVDQDSYNDAANFNVGVLHEAVGNYKKAKEKYDLAFKLKSKEDKYRDALKRMTKQTEYWDQLNLLGISLAEYEFSASTAEMAAATSARIETKGPSSVRHEIKAAPDAASATVARVPGEIELELVEAANGWYRVRLPDGKEGFLQQDRGKMMR